LSDAPRRRAALLALVLATAPGCRRAPAADEIQLWAMGREGEVVQRLLPAFAARHAAQLRGGSGTRSVR
jgi:hypothetical protein